MSARVPSTTLGHHGPTGTVLGLGMAALGRPAYHTLGHAQDVGGRRATPAELEAHAHDVLDAAWDAGIRSFDTARSYGHGEAFLARWLKRRGIAPDAAAISSKWGYTYIGNWELDAVVHEVKEHTADNLRKQWPQTLALLDGHVDVYFIHSATLDTGVLTNREVLGNLQAIRDRHGVAIGLTATGPAQAEIIRTALDVAPELFSVVQATVNLLERAALPALGEAKQAGWGVMVKEGVANGRLTERAIDTEVRNVLMPLARRMETTPDAIALAWLLQRSELDVVLSGAATVDHLRSNLKALDVTFEPAELDALDQLVMAPQAYWKSRKALPWT